MTSQTRSLISSLPSSMRVQTAAETIAFGDAAEYWGAARFDPAYFCWVWNPTTGAERRATSYKVWDGTGFIPYNSPSDRHAEGGNMAFVDGHVKWLRRAALLNNAARPMWAGVRGGWCGINL